jgi:hypothetical protein
MKSFDLLHEQMAKAAEKPKRASDDIVVNFGRHNPPHLGHKRVFDHAKKLSDDIGDKTKADLKLYTSRSQDPKKNPLPFNEKLDHLRRMFPEFADNFDDDPNVNTVLNAATKAFDEGYKNFHFVGGGDRQQEMENLLSKYNGNLYDFQNIYSHSTGEGEDNPEDIIGQLSGSKLRKLAASGKFDEFLQGMNIHDKYTKEDAKELYNILRANMDQVSESWEIDHKNNKDIIRELYVSGDLFHVGDIVESLSTGLIGEVHRCGANHLIIVSECGIMFKSFIHDIHVI